MNTFAKVLLFVGLSFLVLGCGSSSDATEDEKKLFSELENAPHAAFVVYQNKEVWVNHRSIPNTERVSGRSSLVLFRLGHRLTLTAANQIHHSWNPKEAVVVLPSDPRYPEVALVFATQR